MAPSRRRLDAYRLKHAAEGGKAFIFTCLACKNETAFLATDILNIWDPDMQVHAPPARCGRCKYSRSME